MASFRFALILVYGSIAFAEPTIYFKEEFNKGWQERWIESTYKGNEAGKFIWSAGKFYSDPEKDKGIKTSQDARFYGISAKFAKPFSNKGRTLVVQFTVKHEQELDCGGGYVKLFGSDLDQKNLHGDTQYKIMFGPDICGHATKKVHVIFNYKGKNLLIKKEIRCKDDTLTHLYTLIVRSDNTYEVKIDNTREQSGNLEDDWEFLLPRKIKDPQAKKPEDWDEREKIDDPTDKKPQDWDKPQYIADSKAKKPDDWDDEMDGEWEPPQIDNPEYKGEWKPKQIPNPAYKGKWIHPEIDNPDYKPDDLLYKYDDIGAIGFDLWQVKSGSIFDNIIVTDDEKYAEKFGQETWGKMKDGEKKMKDAHDEEETKKREEEKQRKEEEEKKKKEAEDKSNKDEDEKTKKDTDKGQKEKKKEKTTKDDKKKTSSKVDKEGTEKQNKDEL